MKKHGKWIIGAAAVLLILVLVLGILASAPYLAKERPLVVAHRGASASAPENTIAAYEQAIALGADGVETDIFITADDVIVLSHDESIDRCSDGTGLISTMTYAELLTYDFGSWYSPEFAGTKIPRLDEFLDCVKDVELILLELKTNENDIAAKTVAALQSRGMMAQVIFQSFDMEAIQACKAADPSAAIALLYSKGDAWDKAAKEDPAAFCEAYQLSALHPNRKAITGSFARACDAAGIPLRTWTLNKAGQMRAAARKGVVGIVTDQVELAKDTMGKIYQ